jgi:heme A synthase
LAVWRSSALSWIAFMIIVLDGLLGMRPVLAALPRAGAILHAWLALLFLATTAVNAVCTSSGWNCGPERVRDRGWPSLRSLSTATLLLVLIQVGLGTAFRHKVSGLLPHMLGAMLVALVGLVLCMFVTQQFPKHRSCRPAANALLAITLVQVFLGIGTLTVRMMTDQNTVPVILFTMSHVATGGLTLAASVVLAIQIRRHVESAPRETND